MPTLETRVISGKGLVRLDTSSFDYKKAKILTVYAAVVRRATSEYLNFAYNPARSRYCTLNFMRNGHVVRSEAMEFDYQLWDWYPEPSAQTMLAVQCSYDGLLQSFANLGTALGLVVTGVTDQIAEWEWTNLFFDEIKVVCYADTAVRVVVESKPYDLCADQVDKEGEPPPPPPPNPPSVPQGTPLQDTDIPLSEPYEGEDDNGDTIPHPIDVPVEPPEFPQGNRCDRYSVTVSATRTDGFGFSDTSSFFGEIVFIGFDPSNLNSVIVISHGLVITPGSPCVPEEITTQVFGSSSGFIPDSLSYVITPI